MTTQISDALGWTLIHFLWEGAIVAAALAALLVLIRSSRIRYLAACAALLAALATFAITFIYFLPAHSGGTGTRIHLTLSRLAVQPGMNGSDTNYQALSAILPWLAPVWMAGVCLFYLRYAAGCMSLYRMRHRGACPAPDSWQRSATRLALQLKVSRPVLLLESLLADTPMVFGHLRPVILVPLGFLSSLTPDHVEAILLHELMHIRRSDYFVNICQRLAEGLLFYHPAVWWISRVIRAERENCCDDAVVTFKGDAHAYAVALTALEQNRLEEQWATSAAVAAKGGNLVKRINRMLYPKGPTGMSAPILAAVILMVSTGMVLAAWRGNPNLIAPLQQTASSVDSVWLNWLNQDVVYIISDQEKAAFEHLTTDQERQQFVKEFWERRNPTPGAPENAFKQEHYRRIAYANDHWAGKSPGWQTDRGRIYITYGPPDEIESHPSGGNYIRPESEGGGSAMTYPFEDWRYSHFAGVGMLTIEFVATSPGDFRMTLDPKAKYQKR